MSLTRSRSRVRSPPLILLPFLSFWCVRRLPRRHQLALAFYARRQTPSPPFFARAALSPRTHAHTHTPRIRRCCVSCVQHSASECCATFFLAPTARSHLDTKGVRGTASVEMGWGGIGRVGARSVCAVFGCFCVLEGRRGPLCCGFLWAKAE